MNDYKDLLSYISEKKKIDAGALEGLMDNIAAWESDYKNRMTPMPTSSQVGGGPGRGAFQFEVKAYKKDKDGNYVLDEEGNKILVQPASVTAVKRLKQFYEQEGLEIPEWVKELKISNNPDESYNPADLTYDQQKMLFLADTMKAPNKDFAKLNEMSQGEWWGRYHQTQNIPQKVKDFNENARRRYFAENPPVSFEELSGMAGTGLENPLLARTDMFT